MAGHLVVVTGSVVEGVEHGSVVLVGQDGGTYQLGRRWQHLVGRRVRVRGERRDELLTTQQQGVVLTVEAVDDLGAAGADVPPGSGPSTI